MNKSTTYTLCALLIRVGMTGGLQDKLDTFYAMNRLTMEEYAELTATLASGQSGEVTA